VTSGESRIRQEMTANAGMIENRAQRRGTAVPNEIDLGDGVSQSERVILHARAAADIAKDQHYDAKSMGMYTRRHEH
jgi:hypothetical protein